MKYLYLIIICLMIGFVIGHHIELGEPPLPTIMEIQERIGCEKIDGKLGDSWRTSETQRKWDKYLCDQEARIWINKYTMRSK